MGPRREISVMFFLLFSSRGGKKGGICRGVHSLDRDDSFTHCERVDELGCSAVGALVHMHQRLRPNGASVAQPDKLLPRRLASGPG